MVENALKRSSVEEKNEIKEKLKARLVVHRRVYDKIRVKEQLVWWVF